MLEIKVINDDNGEVEETINLRDAVICGDVKGTNGQTVVIIHELNPKGYMLYNAIIESDLISHLEQMGVPKEMIEKMIKDYKSIIETSGNKDDKNILDIPTDML